MEAAATRRYVIFDDRGFGHRCPVGRVKVHGVALFLPLAERPPAVGA
jgi:hypothetical protein